jgi:predicted AlkP superfamily pyrophosphatase or phosphodiesterase
VWLVPDDLLTTEVCRLVNAKRSLDQMNSPRRSLVHRRIAFALTIVTVLGCGSAGKLVKMTAIGRSRELRAERDTTAAATRPGLLIIALDGMKRDVLYDLLHTGALPGLTALLGGRTGGDFPHAYFDRSMIAGLPSITIVGWSSIFSGEPPAANGITGNEFFIREQRRFAAPLPGSFSDTEPALATYTDDYANDLLRVPTLYERLRRDDPELRAWVSVNQFFRGADRLLVAQRRAIVGKVYAGAKDTAVWRDFGGYEERDQEVLDNVIDALADDDDPVPDVLTVYVSGTDSYAHVAPEGPDAALRRFATGKLDASFGRLKDTLERRGALANRYVVVVADHGHSPVPEDGSTLLSTAPRAVLEAAGFRVRPFALDVADHDDFQTVLAYQGPMAYVYVADRSTCAPARAVCDWTRPPRFGDDVIPVAEAFFQADRTGKHAPAMRRTLDLILVRRPRPFAEDDPPFEVYVGRGRHVPVAAYLRRHPHPTYVALESRLRELAVGRYGERAGDVLLIARNGDGRGPDGRYYFNSSAQRSVHGSPSRADAEVPLIVAHPARSRGELQALVSAVVGPSALVRQVTDLALHLRRH